MKIKIMTLGLCLFASQFLAAQDAAVEDFLKRLEAFNEKTTSIVSDFEQVQEFSFLEEKMNSSGKFYFMKPGIMKWDQIKPEPYFFVIKEDEAYKSDGNGIKKIPVNSPQIIGFKKFLMQTMDGSILKSDDFTHEITLTDLSAKITLVPQQRALKRMFSQVRLVFDKKTLLLTELTFYESAEDFRSVYFSQHELNTLTDAAQFTR
ncbi:MULTISPECIES: outer membrane lipoprotein carrier protein LolA [Reichenbachiella]|uniref:Outer membrane lipoprotein-sorting protein n=1 Tax=Reichenbachiella agariperforans TaxID=156994 RepID=A0A1M6PX14_REIAG|nr:MULTISPECIES: outer membrane lipoprotein carrier protein LolA [Reichenbachiella]RJE72874.1 hypothetical protein BGP76_02680 [Reichenbachiella sp. MSK19-1]SHK12524.1 Outer membrane lipoprotein-sorting protein [Reichenbachiella agariperforans]